MGERTGPLAWCYEDFCWFYEQFELPSGEAAVLEGFQRLIAQEIFSTGRVELLVLIPKGQAKTTLMAALAVFHLLVTKNANVYIGAADKIQADEMYRFAAHFVESEPEIAALAKVLRGTREIRAVKGQGFIRVLASDDSKQGGKRQGFNPTLALIDELHAHENDALYTDMRSGLFKRGGILVTITTAGWDVEGVLGKLRQSFLDADQTDGTVERGLVALDDGSTARSADGRLTVARKSHRSAMLEWACRKDDDLTDMAVVKLANPASWVTIDGLEDALESLSPWAFMRYRANVWTLAFDSWLPADAWDNLFDGTVPVVARGTWEDADADALRAYVESLFPEGSTLYVALDMARYRDCAAVVCIGRRDDGPPVLRAIVWRSGGPDHPIAYEPVEDVLRWLSQHYAVVGIAYDPKYFDKSADDLLAENVPMEMFSQSNERMCPAAADLRAAIIGGGMVHDGEPVLGAHVMAATAKDVGDSQFKLVKSSAGGPPIDACVALAMAWALREEGGSMYDDPEATL